MNFRLHIIKTVFVAFFSAMISISAISQDIKYRKDDRPQNVKEDRYNSYQVNSISEIDILKALEMVGIRIFDMPIFPVFEKKYKLSINIDEYVEGKKGNSNDIMPFIYPGKNIYDYWIKDSIEQKNVFYFDYLQRFTFFSKDNDTTSLLTINHLGGSLSGIKLKKNKLRDGQFYNWRSYSKIDWKLNEEVPLLVYASSYYDGKFERFCGAVDLSEDEEATKELFDKSPHYYIISFKVFE